MKAPTATPFINPLDLPIPTGPPPRHPTNPKKRLRADRYLYPRDHEWYALNFPQAGTEYNEEDWYEHISDGSDDCQVLDSVPTVFASRGPEKEGKNSGPAVLRAGEAQHPQEIANPKAYQTEAQRAQIILAAQQLFGPNEKQRHTGEKRQREAENSNNIGKRQKTQAQPQSPQPALTYGHYPPPQGVYDNPYNAGGSRFPSVGYRHQTSAGRHPWGNQQRQGVVNSLAGQQGGQTPGGAPLVRGLQVNSVVNSRYAPAPLPVAEGTIPRYEVRPVRPISRAENDGWLLNNGGLPAADSSGIDFQIDENELREAMEYTDRLFAARAAASNATKTSPTSPANVVPQKLPSSATSNPSRLSTSQAATEQERKMPSTNSPLSNTTWMTPPTSSYPPPTLPSDLPQQKKKRPYRKQSAYWATKESPTTTTAHGKAAEPKQQHRPTYVNDSSWTPTMMEVPLNAEETQKKNISPSAPTQPAEDNPTANLTPAPQSADNDQAAVATNPIVNAFEELYKESTEKDTDSPLSQASPNTPATPPAPQPAGGRPPYIRPQGVRPGSPRDLELQEEYIRRWDLRSKIRG